MKRRTLALALTIIGGVAVYWLTIGIQNSLHSEENRPGTETTITTETTNTETVPPKERMSQLEMDINRQGSDYKDFVATSIDQCLDACIQERDCKAITFTKSSRQCWMKSSVPLRSDNASYISAVKVGS